MFVWTRVNGIKVNYTGNIDFNIPNTSFIENPTHECKVVHIPFIFIEMDINR